MRNVLFLALLISVVALSASMPKNCRGRNCRNRGAKLVQGRPHGAPVPLRPNKLPVRGRRPAPPVVKIPIVAKVPVTKQPVAVPDDKMVTDADGKEIREAGVNGWLAEPTPAPTSPIVQARTEPPSKAAKPGVCDTPKGFGIKCMGRFDQCSKDEHCPGTTKCCMVGECGYMCVKPKPISTEPKEVTKPAPIKKNKGDKNSLGPQDDLTTEASEITETVEVPEGEVKLEDIIEMPKEKKEEMKKAAASLTEPEVEKPQKESVKKSSADAPKTLVEEAEKVLEEVEEEIEKELEEVIEKELEEEIEKELEEEIEKELEEVFTTEVPEDIEVIEEIILLENEGEQ